MNICNKCVLPETEDNNLSNSGECNYCNSPSLLRHISKESNDQALIDIIKNIKKENKDKKYDCIVGWSGGRDSTYLINQLVNVHKLRCVAVFGRTPFTPKKIIENVQNITKKLNIKIIEIDTHEKHLEIAQFCLDQWTNNQQPILINLACAPCKYVNKQMFKIAKKLEINTIIYGGNRFEYFPKGPASVDINSTNRYSFFNMIIDLGKRIRMGINTLWKSPKLFKYITIFTKSSMLYLNQYTIFLRLRYPRIKRFDYFHYAEWDENIVNNVIASIGWELPNNCKTTWRADCDFEAIKNFAFHNQIGFTYSHALYSNLIRAGKMERTTALQRLESEGISMARLEKVLSQCKIDINKFKSIENFQ